MKEYQPTCGMKIDEVNLVVGIDDDHMTCISGICATTGLPFVLNLGMNKDVLMQLVMYFDHLITGEEHHNYQPEDAAMQHEGTSSTHLH